MEAEADPGNERCEVAELAAVERKVFNLDRGDHLANARVLGIDQGGLGHDLDGLGLGRHGHAEGHHGGGFDVHVDFSRLRAEAAESRLDVVKADGNAGDTEGSLGIGRRGTGEPRAGADRGHDDSGKSQTLLVENGAFDNAICPLRKRGGYGG